MIRFMVDPPSGWKYGFPCAWNEVEYPTLEKLLEAKGYPAEGMEFALSYMRMWQYKGGVDSESFT